MVQTPRSDLGSANGEASRPTKEPTFLLRTTLPCHWELFLRWPYIGDLGRMGILGEPDAELRELLEQIDEIRKPADVLFLLRP